MEYLSSGLDSPITRGDIFILYLLLGAVVALLTVILDSIQKQNKWLMEEDEIDKVGEDIRPDEH